MNIQVWKELSQRVIDLYKKLLEQVEPYEKRQNEIMSKKDQIKYLEKAMKTKRKNS